MIGAANAIMRSLRAGRVAGSTGYRNRVLGAYCVPERQQVDEETLSRLIGSIRY